jgi:hypothetical protein
MTDPSRAASRTWRSDGTAVTVRARSTAAGIGRRSRPPTRAEVCADDLDSEPDLVGERPLDQCRCRLEALDHFHSCLTLVDSAGSALSAPAWMRQLCRGATSNSVDGKSQSASARRAKRGSSWARSQHSAVASRQICQATGLTRSGDSR